MENKNTFLWSIPQYTFLFLSFYTTFKFISIFFFKTAFLPRFLFDLTPFHYLIGLDDTQLLLISLIVVLCSTVFHVMLTKRYMVYSFVLSLLLLCGLGLQVSSAPFSLEYLMHYLVFFVLLCSLMIDYRLFLILPEVGGVSHRFMRFDLSSIQTRSGTPMAAKINNGMRNRVSFGSPLDRIAGKVGQRHTNNPLSNVFSSLSNSFHRLRKRGDERRQIPSSQKILMVTIR